MAESRVLVVVVVVVVADRWESKLIFPSVWAPIKSIGEVKAKGKVRDGSELHIRCLEATEAT